MALSLKDRVRESSSTTGTGTITLAGAYVGFQTFASAVTDGDTVYYTIHNTAPGVENEWEVGLGTFTASGTTLSRDTILSSSNSGSAVNFSAGTKEVFIVQPAEKAVYEDSSNNVTVGGKITVGTGPSADLDVATKGYVDNATAAALHYHDPVRVESPTALTAAYDNGTSGVGATLTNSGTQAALVIDGITMATSDRVLVYNQVNAAHNGVYTVTDIGSGSTNWVLTRSTDTDSYNPSDPDSFGAGDSFYVQEGDTGAGESYVMTTTGTITFGTTNINFSQFAATPQYTGTGNIDVTGQVISLTGTVAATNGGTGFASYTTGDILYASSGTALAKLNGVATGNVLLSGGVGTAPAYGQVGLTTHVTGTLPVANGGTGQTTEANAINALLPTQTGNSGYYLTTNGSVSSWAAAPSPNNGTLNMGVSGTGLSGSATFTADQSGVSTFTVTSNATNANTVSTIVARDASGNFSAGTITAALSGNASTATALQTARTIGGVSFDGTANINLPGVDTTGNQNTSGNAATATALQTARTIGGVSFDGTANISLPGVDTAGTQDTSGNAATATSATSATTATTANALNTGNNYQVNSLGVGTAGSGTAGEIRATNNITAYYSSDARLKENVEPISDALDKLDMIRGVTYDWSDSYVEAKGGEDGYFVRKNDVGVIAQEVERVLPQIVGENAQGFKAVRYERLVALLIEAVKELRAEVKALKGE